MLQYEYAVHINAAKIHYLGNNVPHWFFTPLSIRFGKLHLRYVIGPVTTELKLQLLEMVFVN